MSIAEVTGAFAVGASAVTGGIAWLVARFSGKNAELMAREARGHDANERANAQQREVAVRLLQAVDKTVLASEWANVELRSDEIYAAVAELELIGRPNVVKAAYGILDAAMSLDSSIGDAMQEKGRTYVDREYVSAELLNLSNKREGLVEAIKAPPAAG